MRLNRGGDRRANRALHEIVVGRMRHDGRTRAYVARRCSGRSPLTKREAIRCLKRYVAREVWHALTHPFEVPEPDAGGRELREARLVAGMTQGDVASALGVSASSVSKVENGGVSARSGVFGLYAEWVRNGMPADVENSQGKGTEVEKKDQNGT